MAVPAEAIGDIMKAAVLRQKAEYARSARFTRAMKQLSELGHPRKITGIEGR